MAVEGKGWPHQTTVGNCNSACILSRYYYVFINSALYAYAAQAIYIAQEFFSFAIDSGMY
jgi:hypothetical protein